MLDLDCHQTADLLSDHVDEELGPIRRRLVARHLRRCERCSDVYRSLLRTLGVLRTLRGQQPPPRPDLADAVLERLAT